MKHWPSNRWGHRRLHFPLIQIIWLLSPGSARLLSPSHLLCRTSSATWTLNCFIHKRRRCSLHSSSPSRYLLFFRLRLFLPSFFLPLARTHVLRLQYLRVSVRQEQNQHKFKLTLNETAGSFTWANQSPINLKETIEATHCTRRLSFSRETQTTFKSP